MKHTDADLIREMAELLVSREVDLGDERAVLRALNGPLAASTASKFTAGDVMALYDRAVVLATALRIEAGVPTS